MFRLIKTCAMAACVATLVAAALVVPAVAQTKWNLPAAYPADNPHSVNLIAFAKDVGEGLVEEISQLLEDRAKVSDQAAAILEKSVKE